MAIRQITSEKKATRIVAFFVPSESSIETFSISL